jgi:hypothetical protein
MKRSEIKTHLANSNELESRLPDGSAVPAHFHVTEVGQISNRFIGCSGKLRKEDSLIFNCGKIVTSITA